MIINTASKLVKLILFIISIILKIMILNLDKLKTIDCGSIDHCYSDIGCFPLSEEFYHPRHRPFNVRPWHRRKIKTRFELYNREHPDGFILTPWNKIDLIESKFNPNLETKIIIPGWLDNIRRALWVQELKNSFLWLWKPCNIIVVHWRNFTPYTIATANTRVVGAELANLLKFIEHELNYNRLYYHLIGHSLGAHISGYCGDRLPGLGRITALDPARPFFQHMPKSVRLDRNDARFVDAIHSDFTPENAIFLFMSFGMTTPVGHVDFYPNGPPLLQPGCLRDTILSIQTGIMKGLEHNSLPIAFLESIRYLTACDHQRAHQWFIESIKNKQCLFVGVRCNEFEGLINGRCTCDDSKSACAIMGIYADQMYINNAHEDYWPLKKPFLHQSFLQYGEQKQFPSPPPPPLSHLPLDNTIQLNNFEINRINHQEFREQLYNGFRSQAYEMRHPPIPIPSPQSSIIHHQPLDLEENIQAETELLPSASATTTTTTTSSSLDDNFEQIKNDLIFYNYLRSILLMANIKNQQQQQEENLSSKLNDNKENTIRRQDSINEDDDLGLTHFLFADNNLNGHPNLMSDYDRNVENWYEESSRWYLKTHNKPNFCVNQYQVLIFIGSLKTTNGRDNNLRANLILSIIGTRGQILNQRFRPRSLDLESFTMQPFFILLEGSYSLGEILSVAIGWEERLELDPIQATVSFESNLLENIQPILPNYKAKHPWLSETLKYDYSEAFNWNALPSKFKSLTSRSILRRSSDNNSTDNIFDRKFFKRSLGNFNLKLPRNSLNNNRKIINKTCLSSINNHIPNYEFNHENNQFIINNDNNYYPTNRNKSKLILNQIKIFDHDNRRNKLKIAKRQDEQTFINDILPSTIHKITDNNIVAKFHNIGVNLDRDFEDSIVINKVIVSPLQANYGKNGRIKNRKTFCPPEIGYRLKRDQTVRLQPNLMDRCDLVHHHNHYQHEPNFETPVRIVY